jgi:hypothetical protein
MESEERHEASDCKISEKHFLKFAMFNQLSEGHRDFDRLNLMLKTKRRCRLQNFFYFRNMIMDNGGGDLSFLTSVIICFFISRSLCSNGLLGNIRRCHLFIRP